MSNERLLATENPAAIVAYTTGCLLFIIFMAYCCFSRGEKKSSSGGTLGSPGKDTSNHYDEDCLSIGVTNSSGSENSIDDSALLLFMKGRQAGMAEGKRDEDLDAYSIGYFQAFDKPLHNAEILGGIEVQNQATKLGYKNSRCNAYIKGYQYGKRLSKSTMNSEGLCYNAGVKNAKSMNLYGRDCKAYAKGYSYGAIHAERVEKVSDLERLANNRGLKGRCFDLFEIGFQDGMNGNDCTTLFHSKAASQKGLSNAIALGFTSKEATAHADGFQEGYFIVLKFQGHSFPTLQDIHKLAANSGYDQSEEKHFVSGFEEGVDEGKDALNYLTKEGQIRAIKCRIGNDLLNPFIIGYIDGCVYAATTEDTSVEKALLENAHKHQFTGKVQSAYLSGGNAGFERAGTVNEAEVRNMFVPDLAFEKAFLQARKKGSDDETAAADASGYRKGYCMGLIGRSFEAEAKILRVFRESGWNNQASDSFCNGYEAGCREGNQARIQIFLRSKRQARRSGLCLESSMAYASGYRRGYTHSLIGDRDDHLDVIDSLAEDDGYGGELRSSYCDGFNDGQHEGHVIVSEGHSISSDAMIAKGFVKANSQNLTESSRHTYANAFKIGYSEGIRGLDSKSREEISVNARSNGFQTKSHQDAFTKGFADGHNDGIIEYKAQRGKVLSPAAAMERGNAEAESRGLNQKEKGGYSGGYSDGYAVGLAGHKCPHEQRLKIQASCRGFSGTLSSAYVIGFQQGRKEGDSKAIRKADLGLNRNAALKKGLEKAQCLGMQGSISSTFAEGYSDGYYDGTLHVDDNDNAPRLNRDEIVRLAINQGFTEPLYIQTFTAGYLTGCIDGGSIIRHHSLCDVHICTSNSCTICRQRVEPNFLQIPLGNYFK